jgi:RHS repeat-associated protein
MTKADNRTSWIHRSYFANGLVQVDSSYIRTLAGGGGASDLAATPHKYGITYTYDLDRRRASLRHPTQLATDRGTAYDMVSYTYEPSTGALASVTDPRGNVFSYGYSAGGALETLGQAPAAGWSNAVLLNYRYDLDGRLVRLYGGTSPPYTSQAITLIDQSLTFDPRGKILTEVNVGAPADSLVATYSGLGYLMTSNQRAFTTTIGNQAVTSSTDESFTYTGLGNRLSTSTTLQRSVGDGLEYQFTPGFSTEQVESSTGRLVMQYHNGARYDGYHYDEAGNTFFTDQLPNTSTSQGLENRVSYYGADGKLAGADWRMTPQSGNENDVIFQMAFDEFWYDALGRRVLVRSQRFGQGTPVSDETRLSYARRTVWDGDAELWEIQMPTRDASVNAWTENDTDTIPNVDWRFFGNGYVDPNPMWGRVAYTHGLGTDRPLSITRYGYGDEARDANNVQYPFRNLPVFTMIPIWDARGNARMATYGHADLSYACNPGPYRCAYATWPALIFAWKRDQVKRSSWHGTLLEDKRDYTGTSYRRNRYYDPESGRFTQEDPIGLAGGLNLYGFANGDPVNYADPYGLKPDTVHLPKLLWPFLAECRDVSATCARLINSKTSGSEYWEVKLGNAGDCLPYRVGCTDSRPPPGHRSGGTITIIPSEIPLMHDHTLVPYIVVGHEFAHAGDCKGDEKCAREAEDKIRQESNVAPRPQQTPQDHQ